MIKETRRSAWLLIALAVLFATATLPALAQVSQTAQTTHGPSAQEPPQPAAGTPSKFQPALPVVALQHAVPWRDPNTSGPTGFAVPAGAHLNYYGGPIISNVEVIQVLYGGGVYDPQVAGTSSPTMGDFFADFTGNGSGLVDLLTQYNTNISGGTNQTFGVGTFGGLFQIVPAGANNGSTIDDSDIQFELLSQINAGHLPAPVSDAGGNPNTLYMIYFPPGKTITKGSLSSCSATLGFCGYHGTTSITLNSKHVLYGVFPDMQAGSDCASRCGTSTTFGNYTSVTSHELVEAMTDPDVGIAPTDTFASPFAWIDPNNDEIGDICNLQQGSYTANGTTYTIQLEFSNSANDCVLPPDFTLSASPASLYVNPGSSGSSTITVNPTGGFTGSVSLSASGLPAGVTASFGTNPATGSSVLTFTASSTATIGTATITVTGTSGYLTHTTNITLTVSPPDFSLSAAPSSLSVTQGSSGTSSITETDLYGFTGSVTLSASGLPSGVTASFSTTQSILDPTTSARVVTFTASSTATTGTATVTITGISGTLTHTTTITLTVKGFTLSASPSSVSVTVGHSGSSTISVNPSGGFTGSVSLSASGLPAGVTASFSPNPTTSSSTLTFTASSTAVAGTSTITVTGTSGSLTRTTTITLTVPPPDFTLSASPTSLIINPGSSGSSTITQTDLNGFTGSVTLSASGLPSGVTASFSTQSILLNSTTSTRVVTFTASSTAPAGTATVTIRGTSGTLIHTTTITLSVKGFTLSASPSSLSILRGHSGSSTVTVNPVNGFTGSVSLSASGLPSGVTASFGTNPTTSSSSVTFKASSTAATGTATVTIRGTSGALTHTTSISLTIPTITIIGCCM